MSGSNRYRCKKCGKFFFYNAARDCPECGGGMLRVKYGADHDEKPCAVCGTMFKPKAITVVCCSYQCSRERARMCDVARYQSKSGSSVPRDRNGRTEPWAWLRQDVEERGKARKIIDTLHDYPWHDVLSGNMPSMPQWT